MPYYPQSPEFNPLPDQVTDVMLSNMPGSTVKGRTYGAVTGDPANLTGQEVASIIGFGMPPTRHDCRLDYVSGSALRLNRFGGKLITIDGQLREIPAAGVDLAYNGSWVNSQVYKVYATWNGSAIVLAVDTAAHVSDPRDGNVVNVNSSAWTLIGMFYAGGGFFLNATQLLVASYWNRRLVQGVAAFAGVTTAASSPISLANSIVTFLTWGVDAVVANISATATANVAGICGIVVGIDGASQGQAVLGSVPAAGQYAAQTYGIALALGNTGALRSATAMGYTVSGAATGTWSGLITLAIWL